MTDRAATICLTPKLEGTGGMVTFRAKLAEGLVKRGIQVSDDLQKPCDAVLVIGGMRGLNGLRQARRRGVRIVQRLNGMNWIQRRRRTGLRHFLRAEYGNLLLVSRVVVDQFGNDDEVLAQVLQANVVGGATPIFDGNDEVALDPNTPQDLFLCGRIVNNTLEAGPANLGIVFPIPEIGTLDITLERAQLIGNVTADGMVDMMLGGGLSKEEIETNLYPTVLEWLNGEIAADPTGSLATTVLDLLDNNCEPTIAGCDPAPAGCAEDTVIHVDELKCNALLNSALAPDVDIDGDGVKDLISLGLKIVEAVPVTVVAP